MTASNSEVVFHPDRPINSENEDRLGFGVIADNLATSILNAGVNEGFVIGIEGAWGCGKSSILNLLCKKLEDEKKLSIVKFAPWIVGSRDNMVSSLMASLSAAIEEIESKNHSTKGKIKKGISLAEKVRKYGAQAGRTITPLAKLAAIAIPGASAVAEVAEALSGINETASVPLADLKDELTESLRDLGQTFVVVVDDIDRLEPEETVEITRLIRAVGDFPNVIYVLCYDKAVLTQSLEAALGIASGSSYLQKIIQASFAVPKPEEFDLRRWLTEECHKLYEVVTGERLSEEHAERLRVGCDTQGEQIATPREINLVLNSLRLAFPPLAGKVDFPDLCWLHIIKIKNENLYRWIEDYLNIFAVVIRREGTITKSTHKKMAKELLKFLESGGDDGEDDYISGKSLWNLKDFLPGINSGVRRNQSEEIILNTDDISDSNLTKLEVDFRLASPSHYRLYFAFAQPSGVLSESTLSLIMSVVAKGGSPVDELNKLLAIKRVQGGTMYEVFLDRLKRHDISKLNLSGLKALTKALTDTIDDALRGEREPGFFGLKSVGRDGRTILGQILLKIAPKKRAEFIEQLFKKGKSIGWLMSDVIGDELYSHGRTGNRENSDRQILTASELDAAIKIMDARLTGSDGARIQDAPNPGLLFYRWQQSGAEGKKHLSEWMAKFAKPDAGFLRLLELCRGYAVSSDKGVYRPLNDRDLKNFFGSSKAVKTRLTKLSRSSNAKLKKDANAMLEAIKLGERHGDGDDD